MLQYSYRLHVAEKNADVAKKSVIDVDFVYDSV